MSIDESLFVFGHQSTPEYLAERAYRETSGLFHGARINPVDPAPNEPVQVLIDAASEAALDHVCVDYTTDGSLPNGQARSVPASRLETRWNELAGRYVDPWTALVPPAKEGTSVRYVVKGESQLTDNKICADNSQAGLPPDLFGYDVDGLSSPSWINDAVIYQIFVDRFYHPADRFGRPLEAGNEVYGGSLEGVWAKLDYLTDLGINVIWLTPIFEAETYHRYDALDFERIADGVGGAEGLRSLVAEAHRRGIRILLDFAANHCSWHHKRFLDAQHRPDSPYRNWFTFTDWPRDYQMFFTSRYLPQLNTHNPDVVAYLCDQAAACLKDYGVDGFRLDYALGPPLLFWTEFRARCKRAKSDSYTVGEATTNPASLSAFQGRLDGCLDFPMLQKFREFFVHGSIDAVAFHGFLQRNCRFYQPGFTRPTFLDNHDMNRFLWSAGNDVRKLKLAALCQFTLPQPPIIYYGTEVGLSQEGNVTDLGFEAARLPMTWGDRQDEDLLSFYRNIIQARRRYPALRGGERRPITAASNLYAYRCLSDHDDDVVVALNNSDEAQEIDLPGVQGIDVVSGAEVDDHIRLAAFEGAMVAPAPDQ